MASQAELKLVNDLISGLNIKEHFEIVKDRNKVKCLLTKHEIPCTLLSVQSYVNGKKFKRLSMKLEEAQMNKLKKELSYQKYSKFFVPSKKTSGRLFCLLTRKEVNELPHELQKYTMGIKFQKALMKYKEDPEAFNLPSTSDQDDNADEDGDDNADEDGDMDCTDGIWVPSDADSDEGSQEEEVTEDIGCEDEQNLVEKSDSENQPLNCSEKDQVVDESIRTMKSKILNQQLLVQEDKAQICQVEKPDIVAHQKEKRKRKLKIDPTENKQMKGKKRKRKKFDKGMK